MQLLGGKMLEGTEHIRELRVVSTAESEQDYQ